MSKKPKKGGAVPAFKIQVKTDDEKAQVAELQLKKKLLEERLANAIEKRKDAYQKMMESKERAKDIKNVRNNEEIKFSSIKADFKNNSLLYEKNYKAKIDELKGIQEEKENKIASFNAKLEEMKNDQLNQVDLKNKMLTQIRANMDELSQYFSKQLEEIQKSLQGQIDKISAKWEFNITEPLKKYEEHVKKYDMNKEI